MIRLAYFLLQQSAFGELVLWNLYGTGDILNVRTLLSSTFPFLVENATFKRDPENLWIP